MWDKGRKLLGVAWVVPNHKGVVNCHSRRAFSEVLNKEDAQVDYNLMGSGDYG